MILREPKQTREDCDFVVECYEGWPESDKGPVYASDVRNWFRRYNHRAGEKGLIAQRGNIPIGWVIYEQNLFVAVVYELAISATHRGRGFANEIIDLLYERLTAGGVVVAEFSALPGPIADKVSNGQFKKISEGIGAHTGLPIIRGQATPKVPNEN